MLKYISQSSSFPDYNVGFKFCHYCGDELIEYQRGAKYNRVTGVLIREKYIECKKLSKGLNDNWKDHDQWKVVEEKITF